MSSTPTVGAHQVIEEVTELSLKTCRVCGKILPLTDFSIKRSAKDNRMSICKPCDRHRSREYYMNNPEYFKRYKKENRDRILLKARECNFLYRSNELGGGYLKGTGICVFCSEINPSCLSSTTLSVLNIHLKSMNAQIAIAFNTDFLPCWR